MAGLILQASQHGRISIGVHVTVERSPLRDELSGRNRAFVVRIVNVLDHCLSGVKHVCVRNVVKEKHQFIGSGGERLIKFLDGGRILADEAGAGGDGAVHSNAGVIRSKPLAPAIVFRGIGRGTVVGAGDVRQRSEAERSRIAFVGVP